jgi:hypothetical membrane protein
MKQWFLDVHPTLGLAGSAVILVCILVAMSVYRGKNGERFSIWRHFVSELGEVGVSRFAWVFNAGLIIGGFLFFLMMPGVGLSLNSLWGYLATISGMIAAIGCLFVGVYPMNNIKPHIKAAMTYFRAGLATVILFSIAILAQDQNERIIPLYALFVSGVGIISYASFLFNLGKSLKQRESNALDTSTIQERPRFWLMPLLEWMVVIFTILWFLIISVAR